MGTPPLSNALAQEAVNILATHDGNKSAAAKALGLGRGAFQNRVNIAEQRGMTPNAGTPDADDVQALKARVKRLETALRAHDSQSDHAQQIKALIGKLARQVELLDPPAWLVRDSGAVKSPGVPTLFLSDLHWGEVVYPSQINGVNE